MVALVFIMWSLGLKFRARPTCPFWLCLCRFRGFNKLALKPPMSSGSYESMGAVTEFEIVLHDAPYRLTAGALSYAPRFARRCKWYILQRDLAFRFLRREDILIAMEKYFADRAHLSS